METYAHLDLVRGLKSSAEFKGQNWFDRVLPEDVKHLGLGGRLGLGKALGLARLDLVL